MPRRRRGQQSSSNLAQIAAEKDSVFDIAEKDSVFDIAVLFAPCKIVAGLGRLWVLDEQRLSPAVDVAGRKWECPITLESIASPVLLDDGHVYEEMAILQWLRQNEASPFTNLPLKHKSALRLAPLKQTIELFLSQSPAPRKCPLDRMKRAMKDADNSTAHPAAALEQLEARLAEFAAFVHEAQAIFDSARAQVARARNELDAKKERCATLMQAAYRAHRARQVASQLRYQARMYAVRKSHCLEAQYESERHEAEYSGSVEVVAALGSVILFRDGLGHSRANLGVVFEIQQGGHLHVSFQECPNGRWRRTLVQPDQVCACLEDTHAVSLPDRYKISGQACRSCGALPKADVRLAVCSGCRKASYCSRECQHHHLRHHRQVCRPLPTDEIQWQWQTRSSYQRWLKNQATLLGARWHDGVDL